MTNSSREHNELIIHNMPLKFKDHVRGESARNRVSVFLGENRIEVKRSVKGAKRKSVWSIRGLNS